MDESFYLSNMSPQIGVHFNRHYWADLEKRIRDWAQSGEVANLFVVTGPVYEHTNEQSVPGKTFLTYQVIGPSLVAVPTHYFKVLLVEMTSGEVRVLALLLPNKGINNAVPLDTFLARIDDIERAAGLDFFNRLPDEVEKEYERALPEEVWFFSE